MSESRITALEERIAYQDQTIEELNGTVMALWKEIEGLKRQLARLGEQLEEVSADLPQQPDRRPPHY